ACTSSPALRILPFSFNYPPTPDTSTLSLHDALPIFRFRLVVPASNPSAGLVIYDEAVRESAQVRVDLALSALSEEGGLENLEARSEEHTSELQSLTNLVCRLLLEKKKNTD